MSAPIALLAALLCAPARAQLRTAYWGQDTALPAVFAKVASGARGERWARESQGWFSRVIGREPAIQAAVRLDDRYLPQDSPMVAEEHDSEAVVEVGRAALDVAQSEAEMAFLLGHELHHALVRRRKAVCLERGLAKLGSRAALQSSPELLGYRLDLEREADAWGQRYAADAGYSAFAAVDAIRHVGDLGETLGVEPDGDHDAGFLREDRLKAYGREEPFTASCPWGER